MYLYPFKNRYPDQDFTLIADTIKTYFPINKTKRLTPKTVASSPGFKKVGKIVNSEFLNQKAYREKWGKLIENLKAQFKKPVHGHPDLSGGGFFGEVMIEEYKKRDFIQQKSLKFYVSILGPFFSIHGVDSSTALLEIESRTSSVNKVDFPAIHAITISPVFEYQDAFNKLEDELRSFFPGYLFVPYTVGMSTIKNISVADESRDPRILDTVYEAVFGLGAVHGCLTRGDEYYGIKDWVKPLSKKEKSLIDLIAQHIIAAPKEKTIHRVWKLHESKRLDTFPESRDLMVGVELFDVIDLTGKSSFIMMSKERGSPSTGKYKIRDEVIEINSNCSFRIMDLSRNALTLNLVMNFEYKSALIKGEVLQVKFAAMKSMH